MFVYIQRCREKTLGIHSFAQNVIDYFVTDI